jgi:hypothetical protein
MGASLAGQSQVAASTPRGESSKHDGSIAMPNAAPIENWSVDFTNFMDFSQMSYGSAPSALRHANSETDLMAGSAGMVVDVGAVVYIELINPGMCKRTSVSARYGVV